MKCFLLFVLIFSINNLHAQRTIHGEVRNASTAEVIAGATIIIGNGEQSAMCDEKGRFNMQLNDSSTITISAVGFEKKVMTAGGREHLVILLSPIEKELDAIVVTGTMRAVKRLESPVAVEVYTPQFLKKNPAPSIFESLQNVNGV